MSPIAKFALLAVVFVDLLGQGLVFPIINELVMQPQLNFLPVTSSAATRHIDYGLVLGVFFLCWFLGSVYISKLSDTIGRKNAIMICLFGALVGYVITIASLYMDSLWMLILGRAVTGFTAGNQPIAQAAMVDASRTDEEKGRNMGYIVAGISAGLVGGPIIGGFLSDKAIIGDLASIKLPFYFTLVLVLATIVLVQLFFKDVRKTHEKLKIDPKEVYTQLLRIREYPVIVRLSMVFIFFHIANVTFYIFMDNYLTSRFGIGLFGTSMSMLGLGIALAISSTFLVGPSQARFSRRTIITVVLAIMMICAILFIVTPVPFFTYVLICVFYFAFGIAYPTFLSIYSDSVSAEDQGWVMGITVAHFTLAAGIMSLVGGGLMALDIRLPFYVSAVAAAIGLILMRIVWRSAELRRITD